MQVCVPTSDIVGSSYGTNAAVSSSSSVTFGSFWTCVDDGVVLDTGDYLYGGGGGSNNATFSGVACGVNAPVDPGVALRVPGDFTVVGAAQKFGGQQNFSWSVILIQRNVGDTADVTIASIGGSNTASPGPYTTSLTQPQITSIDFTRLSALRLQFNFSSSPATLFQTVGTGGIFNGYFTFPDIVIPRQPTLRPTLRAAGMRGVY